MNTAREDIQDELLVLQCQDGDDDAMEMLIARWQGRFGRLAWRLTGQREAARDVAQETWLAIVRGIRRLDDPARFRIWAYRIVSNKSADWIRRRGTARTVARDLQETAARTDPSQDGVQDGDRAGEVDSMRTALAQLPDEQRAILSLHYLDQMDVARIARVLNVPVGTVKSRLHHARGRLKQTLERIKP